MSVHIAIKLFATLVKFMPPSADRFEIADGATIRELLKQVNLPEEKATLIFVDGVKADLDTVLQGGERVGIFPPVGGG